MKTVQDLKVGDTLYYCPNNRRILTRVVERIEETFSGVFKVHLENAGDIYGYFYLGQESIGEYYLSLEQAKKYIVKSIEGEVISLLVAKKLIDKEVEELEKIAEMYKD